MKSTSLPPEPCHCEAPNEECQRAGQPMLGRLWEYCHGVNCNARLSEAKRRQWDRKAGRLPLATVGQPVKPARCIHLGKPTGEMAPYTGKTGGCGGCSKKTQLKLFACSHPAHKTTTLPACKDCGDREVEVG